MPLRPYKFIVTAVVQQLDAEGNVIDEPTADAVAIFGCTALARWATEFPKKLAETEEPVAPSPPNRPMRRRKSVAKKSAARAR